MLLLPVPTQKNKVLAYKTTLRASSMVSGSGSVIGEEGCEREEGGKTRLVITVEDVDHQEATTKSSLIKRRGV